MKSLAWLLVAALAGCAHGASGGDDDSPGDPADADPNAPDGGSADAFVDSQHGWQPLGNGIDVLPGASGHSPRVAIAADGQPVVAFVETGAGAGASIYVYRWTGTTWLGVGSAIDDGEGNATAGEPDLEIAADGTLYLSYAEYSESGGGTAYHVVSWSGTAWAELPGSPLQEPELLTAYNDLLLASDGTLWLAITERVNNRNAFKVWRYDGSWHDVGGDEDLAVDAYLPLLTQGPGGEIYLSWESIAGIKVRQYNPGAGTWLMAGGNTIPVPSGGFSSPNSPALGMTPGGKPIMGFHCYKDQIDGVDSFVAVLDGGSWTFWGQALQAYVGQFGSDPTYARMEAVTGVPGSETLALAWSEQDGTGEQAIYVDRCTAAGCNPLGRQRLNGVTGATTHAGGARMTADSHGRVVVVWQEQTGSESKIFAWRYHGDPDN